VVAWGVPGFGSAVCWGCKTVEPLDVQLFAPGVGTPLATDSLHTGSERTGGNACSTPVGVVATLRRVVMTTSSPEPPRVRDMCQVVLGNRCLGRAAGE
jgi:hypothetical protein